VKPAGRNIDGHEINKCIGPMKWRMARPDFQHLRIGRMKLVSHRIISGLVGQ